MKLNTVLMRTLVIIMLLFTVFSCQDDFLEVGKGLVDSSNFTSGVQNYDVVAYSEQLFNVNGVQTNGLNVGILGYYNDPLYGTTTTSTLSQVSLNAYNTNYGANPVIDSVVFSMPYFSSSSVNSDNKTVFKLDSVYGTNPIKLTAYRSNYLLTDNAPPDFTNAAIYYSNDLSGFSGLESKFLFQKEFVPSPNGVITKEPAASTAENQDPVNTTNSPRLRFRLDELMTGANSEYWQNTIFAKQGSNELFNENAFRNYFRGIYLKAESIDNKGNYFLFDKPKTNITIYYKSGADNKRTSKTIVVGFSGNSVIGYDNDFKTSIADELAGINKTEGESNLFLKGGQGSMAVVELFGPDDNNDGIPDELATERSKNRLVREANLEFFVAQDKISELSSGAIAEPERIYVYDLETNRPFNEFIDSRTGEIGAQALALLGPLTRTETGEGISYKIRITEYIKGLLNKNNDSPNTKLGVVVVQNPIAATLTGRIENKTATDFPNRIPFASVVSQKGTILYGSNPSVPENKRLKLKIFYSEAAN